MNIYEWRKNWVATFGYDPINDGGQMSNPNPNPNVNTGDLLRQISQLVIDRDAFMSKLAAERFAHDETRAELRGAEAVISQLKGRINELEGLSTWFVKVKREHVRENE